MAGGNKKKKKPAANPARGFATTSTVSKVKADVVEPQPESVKPVKSDNKSQVEASTHSTKDSNHEKELSELTPDELEEQLRLADLQQFVDQYASKVRKEATRQATKIQTEKRLLRSQAELLFVREWLSNELISNILKLCSEDEARQPTNGSGFSATDEFVSKAWQVYACLVDLGFTTTRAQEAIADLIARNSLIDTTQALSDALDWIALRCQDDELLPYDTVNIKNALPEDDEEKETEISASAVTSNVQPPEVTNSQSDGEDIDVSDLDSDMEADQLVSKYLDIKTKLFDIDPNAHTTTNTRRKANTASLRPQPKSSKIQQRLQAKINKIESDMLFDQREADAQWSVKQIHLLRDHAERKRLQLEKEPMKPTNDHTIGVNEMAEKIGEELLQDGQDDDILGGMFDALPGVSDLSAESNTTSGPVTIRDFGKVVGMSPPRILEDICKARDPRSRLTFKMISSTTYSSRHSVTIHWTQDQEIVQTVDITSLELQQKRRSFIVSMIGIATPDTSQSEAYVATAALFLLASDSPKEAKASLRLPPAFRDVWDELVKEKKEQIDAKDRETVREMRELVEKNTPAADDPEEIIYNPASRRVNGNSSGTTTPLSETALTTALTSQALADMWQQKQTSPAYQNMLKIRQNLPMFAFRQQALDTISQHQITILCGETGCGKSTQLPAFIVEQQLSQGKDCRIYCTEPRRISAISLAQRVSEEMGERKGDVGSNRSLVGYAIRLESHIASSTKLIYATVGIVLRMLENADGIDNITHLVLDEVHERSIDTDFLLIVLRSLLLKRPDLKVVLMSATVDAQRFSNYFDGAPIINVPGRTFPVEARFLEDAIELTGHTQTDIQKSDEDEYADVDSEKKTGELQNYSKRTRTTLATYDEYLIDYELILKLLQHVATDRDHERFSKAILVFLPGIAEIRQLNDMLAGHQIFRKAWTVHPLHSSFSSEDQQAAFLVPPHGMRKIVLATNIAETGITIPDVTCVIDTGKHKEMRFDERRQMSRLIQSFIARANAKQRRGRAGRVQEGKCYHLFTRYRHDHIMVDQQTPEMLRLSLQDLVMRVKICKLGNIEQTLAQALDPPSSKNVRRAIDALVEVNALTTGEDLTSLGRQIAKLPLDAQLGKLVLFGCVYGCLDFALTIAATLSSKSPFLSPLHAKKQAESVRLGFKKGDSDLLTAYNAYSAWRKICQTAGMSEAHFCNKNFLSSQNLANIEDLKGQLLSSLVDAGFVTLGNEEKHALSKMRHNQRHRHFVAIPISSSQADTNEETMNTVVAWSFYPKLLRRDGKGWRNVSNNQSLGLHPTSVNKQTLPNDVKNLSFYSIMQTSSRFTNAQETSPVSDFALVLLAGEASFNMYAGVIVIDGNRMRYSVRDWKTMLALKMLRSKLKECQARLLKSPGKALPASHQQWMQLLTTIFTERSNNSA